LLHLFQHPALRGRVVVVFCKSSGEHLRIHIRRGGRDPADLWYVVSEEDEKHRPMTLKRFMPVAMLALAAAKANACATCAGGDNLQLVEASNAVLWSLLGLVGFIFAATGATAYFLWRKATTPTPAHLQLIESLNPADAED
jgi:hypothetical protein